MSSLASRRLFREQDCAAFAEAIQIRNAHTTEKFSILLRHDLDSEDMTTVTEREQAGKRMRSLSAGAAFVIVPGSSDAMEIGRYRGFSLLVTIARTPTGPAPQVYVQVGPHQLAVNIGESDAGATMSLDARLRSFDTELQKAQEEVDVLGKKIASLETEINRPWEHEERCAQLKAKAAELEKELDLSTRGEASLAAAPVRQEVDTSAEVLTALADIRALHANPAVIARFAIEAVEITPVTLDTLERQVEQAQAQLEFAQAILAAIPSGETVQLGLFGDFAVAPTKKRRR